MSPSVRRLDPDDIAAMDAVERACFPDDAWTPAMLLAQIGRADGIGLGLVAAETAPGPRRLSGLALGWAAGGVAELLRIAVSPVLRRQGSGRALLGAFLGQALDRGAEEIWLEVRADNTAALGLYRAAGFEESGRRRRYYSDGVDAVLMTALKERISG